jgi:succinate-semialdehyde dehydrogenase / glutarate-semialdehyde dehydrogenase
MAIASVNPATGERLREFAPLSLRELDDRVARASAAFRQWRATPIRDRAAVVGRAADLLDAEKARFGKLMTLEMGKLFGASRRSP